MLSEVAAQRLLNRIPDGDWRSDLRPGLFIEETSMSISYETGWAPALIRRRDESLSRDWNFKTIPWPLYSKYRLFSCEVRSEFIDSLMFIGPCITLIF